MLTIGTKAPAITLIDHKGQKQTLSQYKGGNVLVYFYPKAMTPGCVKEACGFRDILKDLKKANITVLGISLDDDTLLKQFAKQDKINFPLLSDVKRKISSAYDVLKSSTDKKGVISYSLPRVSYLIDGKGLIIKVYASVTPDKHAMQVLKDVNLMSEIEKKVPAKAVLGSTVKSPAKVVVSNVSAKAVAKKQVKTTPTNVIVPASKSSSKVIVKVVAPAKKAVVSIAKKIPVKNTSKTISKKLNIENPVVVVEEIAIFEIEEL